MQTAHPSLLRIPITFNLSLAGASAGNASGASTSGHTSGRMSGQNATPTVAKPKAKVKVEPGKKYPFLTINFMDLHTRG